MGRFCKEYFFRPWPFCHDGYPPKHFLWLFLCATRGSDGVGAMDITATLLVPLSPDCPAAHGSGLEGKSAFVPFLLHAVVRGYDGYHHECFYVEMD